MSRDRTMVDLPEGVVLHTARGVFKGEAPADLFPLKMGKIPKIAEPDEPLKKKGSNK